MKRFLHLFLCAALLGSAGLKAENVVFVNDSGADTNDGLTPETAVKSMTKALDVLSNQESGTVVINGKFTQSANFTPTKQRQGTVTYTQKYNGIDYRSADGKTNNWFLTKGVRFGVCSDAVFENVDFYMSDAVTSNPFFLLMANYNAITIGEGCRMAGGFKWGEVANSFTIIAGAQDNANNVKPGSPMNPNVTILSGDVLIVAYNRGGSASSYNVDPTRNMAVINLNGGTLHNLYIDTVGSGKFGSTTVNVGGINLKKYGVIRRNGTGASGVNNTLNVKGLDLEGQYSVLEYTDVRIFENVETDLVVPVNVYESGYFTASDETVLPYRYYTTPAAKATDPKCVVLYLHGMGSRGTDNSTQLSSMGAAQVYPLTNEMSNTLILAPQIPSPERWVTETGGFQFISEQTKWLTAALELTQAKIAEEGIAPENVFAVGSSNGAAALWSLMHQNNNPFARLIPVAGYGETSTETVELIANIGQTPVWAFHGTADTTIPVEGMQAFAPQLSAANANFRYTEVPGDDHNTVWRTAALTPGFCQFFTQPVSSGIAAPGQAAAGIEVNGDTVTVKAARASLYTVDGALKSADNAAGDTKTFGGLAKGVYIVTADGTPHKVLIR